MEDTKHNERNWEDPEKLRSMSSSSLRILSQWKNSPMRRMLYKRETKSMGQLVGAIMSRYKTRYQNIVPKKQLIFVWQKSVGVQMSKLSCPEKISQRSIIVNVSHPVVRTELQLLDQKKILLRLNKQLSEKLNRIIYRIK